MESPSRRLSPQFVPVDRVPYQQRLRAVPEQDRLHLLFEDRGLDLFERLFGGAVPRGLAQVLDDSFEEVDEALRSRVHDARFRQGLHLLRRVLEGLLRYLERLRKQLREVLDRFRPVPHFVGPVA
jgi:hypothetical protein